MKKAAIFLTYQAVLFLYTGTSAADLKTSLDFPGPGCEVIDCDSAYAQIIKQQNPNISDKETNEIISAVNHYSELYFQNDKRKGIEVTLSIISIESLSGKGIMGNVGKFQDQIKEVIAKKETDKSVKKDSNLPQTWNDIHTGMAYLDYLYKRYDGNWYYTIMAYKKGPENVDKLRRKGQLQHFSDYFIKVKKKMYRIFRMKEAIFKGKKGS